MRQRPEAGPGEDPGADLSSATPSLPETWAETPHLPLCPHPRFLSIPPAKLFPPEPSASCNYICFSPYLIIICLLADSASHMGLFRPTWHPGVTDAPPFALIPVAALTNYRKPRGSKQQRWILSQFWRPEVENEGRATLPLRPPGENPSLSPPASGGSRGPLALSSLIPAWPPSSHGPPSRLLSGVSPLFVNYKDTCHWI